MIDLRYVKKLIDIIDDSSVDSIEITSDKGLKIRISKSPTQRGAVQVAAPMTIPTMLPAAALGRADYYPGHAAGAADGPTVAIRRHPGRHGRRRSGSRSRARTAEVDRSRGEVPDGGGLLQIARAGRQGVRRGRRPCLEGTNPLHHRSNEDHERDRVRTCGGGARSPRTRRDARAIAT